MGFNQNLQSLLRHTLRLGSLEDLTADQRRTLWPPASPLEERHIKNCKVVESREKVLTLLPTGSKCAELGIWKGDFSAMILDVIKPVELHLIDIEQSSIEIVRKRFHSEIDNKKVFTYLGDSASVLASMPDRYFDWVYVDADHSYPAVHNDLKITHQKIKSDGLIALNDYVFFFYIAKNSKFRSFFQKIMYFLYNIIVKRIYLHSLWITFHMHKANWNFIL